MYMQNKRVVAIHDLSGVGRCSLTVIMPILSAMGVQACPVPTAILSTHTGGFGEVAFQDLTDYLPQALAHYQRLGLDFSCIYSGFLGSEAQIDHCLAFFKAYPSALAVVDPVMGDHGKPYRTVTEGMRRRMVELVSIADVITPNLTEACILLGEPYHPMPLTRAQAAAVLHKFANELDAQNLDEAQLREAPVHPVPDAGYLLGDIIYRYRIPEVELPGVDTAQVNQEIQNAYGQLYEDAIASMEQGIAPTVDEIGYFWNVRKYGDKILSLVTWERSNETNYRFRVWNISMETGQQWNTGEAVLELSADSLKGYELAAQEALDAAFDKWVEFRGTVDAGLAEELRQQTLSPENLSLEGVPLFFGTDGQLWMAGCVWHDLDSQRRFVCLPLGDLARFWDR